MDNNLFWDVGPHEHLEVEKTFHKFIKYSGGIVVEETITKNPKFNNADYYFDDKGVISELKTVQTEFLRESKKAKQLNELILNFKSLDQATDHDIQIFNQNLIKLVRPPLLRILKKANKQIKETVDYYKLKKYSGVLFFVNEEFTDISPDLICFLIQKELKHSYSSINCFVYVSVNRYIVINDSIEPKLVWFPVYNDSSDNDLVTFIDDLGRKWFSFLEEIIGPFDSKIETQDTEILVGSKSLILPSENK